MNWGWLLFSLEGRVGRTEWWSFVVVEAILGLMVAGIGAGMAVAVRGGDTPALGMVAFLLFASYAAVVIWTGLAISVKRWHDVDKSGWWILAGVIPFAGVLIVLYFNGFAEGTRGSNRFGEPLG
ncbi:MAG: DUF805 domain-containing protein [Ardenticatenales bacterium]|nr:DUF805 domain-containing protein [Ardenticatenales bacterium]